MRNFVLKLFFMFGGFRLWRYLKRDEVIILCLHGVMDDDVETKWVPLREQYSRALLDQSLQLLKKHYNFVSLDEALEMLSGERPIAPYSMVLTFDDGYLNNKVHALPILRTQEVPCVMYIACGHVEERKPFWFDRLDYAIQQADLPSMRFRINSRDTKLDSSSRVALKRSFKVLRDRAKQGDRDDYLMLEELSGVSERLERQSGRQLADIFETDDWSSVMSWQQVAEVSDDPLVEIGSHTVGHIRLGKVTRDVAMRELIDSKAILESKTGKPCRHFCYPDGSVNVDTPSYSAQAGYASAVTTVEGTNPVGVNPMLLKRIHLPDSEDPRKILLVASGLASAIDGLR